MWAYHVEPSAIKRDRIAGDAAQLLKPHLFTSSASNCIEFGTSKPSAFVVFMLTTSSNLFDVGQEDRQAARP